MRMSYRSGACLTVALTLFAVNQSSAQAPVPPRVPGFERFYATAPATDEDEDLPKLDPVTGGRLLLGELNCVACHDAGPLNGVIRAKQAPVLTEVGGRVRTEWLRQYLLQPHVVKPGTTMPDLLAGLPEAERRDSVEALVHLLASTGHVTEAHPDASSAKKGAALFQQVGCVACHASLDGKLDSLTTSIALPDLGAKYSVPSLMAFLKDPLKARPAGRMPSLGLKDEEYRDLAHAFVKGVKLVPTLRYAVYEGNWNDTPDFRKLTPGSTGECAGLDLTVAGRENNFGIRFTGFLKISKPGQYQFFLGSDDGSRLTIGETIVVENGGVHPHTVKAGKAVLDVGFHPIAIEYFQGGGEWTLDLEISGGGLKQQSIAGLLSLEARDPEPAPGTAALAINPDLVEKGRGLFASLGCASCHDLKLDQQRLASTRTARPLADLSLEAGCLAENVSGRVPQFDLSAAQRASLVATLKGRSADETRAEGLHRTLASLNCYACHKRGAIGGAEEARNPYFDTRQKEMGDEGRLPPLLTGVGDKLRKEWLRQLLLNGADDRRQSMLTRMPRFGDANVGPLVDAFVTHDLKPDPVPAVTFTEPEYRIKAAGRHLVGGQALSCIKCHDFGPHQSTGIRAVNLTTMHQRLRPEWVDRYLRDPQLFKPGTRMPAPWPFGMATIRDVLNADVDQQIAAVRLYLADGGKAAVPVGLVREPMELIPTGEPIIYRNFIEGSGSRAIGVGYPERVNLAWDANEMRLALIWHGAFIDASRHWTGRGVGFEAPLGDHLIALPGGSPLASLASPNDPWPNQPARESGFRFQGYRLDENQRPTFRYAFQGMSVEDQLAPRPDPADRFAGLTRTVTVSGSAAAPLYFRAMAAGKIEKLTETDYRIDGFWTLSITGSEAPQLRQSGSHSELLVPLRPDNNKATVRLGYRW